MSNNPDKSAINPAHLSGPGKFVAGIVGSRFALYLYDFIYMKFDVGERGRELGADHLICRFCGNPIELIGAWKCTCGFKRPGNYFGRCPKCLMHPRYIDCPVCRFTMDVR